MSDFLKDHGEVIVAAILGLIGFGKVWQKNVDTEIRVKKIEDGDAMIPSIIRLWNVVINSTLR